ncbi:MAG: formylglycine-generating enzyme family protein, partial [Kiritimatiellae bacterium]|nr:formylglycine-generating enzyme family protein [Kiritimatiellia bacterium]
EPACAPAAADPGRRSVALPGGVALHLVRLPGGPWIAECETTQPQWTAVLGYNPSAWPDDPVGDRPPRPVETVTIEQARAFCAALSGIQAALEAGLRFRLPTDAEWERACLAGGSAPATAEELDRAAVHRENGWSKAHPAKSREPNAYGLYDMLGNVWEWVEAPDGNVFRGGCAFTPPEMMLSGPPRAVRNAPGYAHSGLGFRVCAD